MRTPIEKAREVLGPDVLGAEEIGAALGGIDSEGAPTDEVPFGIEELRAAKENGALLVLRTGRIDGEALTLLSLLRRFPDAFEPRHLESMGYQLKTDWGIALEPLAGTETCAPKWALVHKELLRETINLSHEEQEDVLRRFSEAQGVAGRVRRRRAIEIVFDLLVYQRTRGKRLLATTWDWSSSRTVDGGYLNVGGFSERGMQIFSYSKGIRHGRLGTCPNIDPAAG